MEPSFYTDLHKACREMDVAQLDTLGPLAFAMHWIVKLAETNKSKKVTLGAKLHKPEKELTHELGAWCSGHAPPARPRPDGRSVALAPAPLSAR